MKLINTTLNILALILATFTMSSPLLAEGALEKNNLQLSPTWTINHKSVDIRAFLNQVSSITGKTFIIDPNVTGKISILSDKSLDKEGVIQLFFSVLSVHGYTAIQTESGIKILPENKAKSNGIYFDEEGKVTGSILITQIIPIQNAVASDLVPILRPLIPSFGHIASANDMNALIVSDHAENIRELEKLIQNLDKATDLNIRVVNLKHAWASDMLETLSSISGGSQNSSEQSNQGAANGTKVTADERTNRLILQGKDENLNNLEALISELDVETTRSSRLHVIPLRYADAETTATLISSLLSNPSSTEEQNTASMVVADKDVNQLVVRADPSIMGEISPVIEEMDVPRAQVKIDAVIAEINMDNIEEAGIQWLLGGTDGTSTPVAGTNFTSAGNSISSIATSIASGTPTLTNGGTIGAVFSDGKFNLGGILQAIDSSSAANLLSNPSITVMDNKIGKVLVGQNIPVETGSYNDTTGNPFTITERQDVGLTLQVTPHINANNEVRLEVSQVVEAVSSEVSTLGFITTKREIVTDVIVPDGEVLFLGGLFKNDEEVINQKVPVLGDIPLFGALFRSSSTQLVSQNLVVYIRPTILRDRKHIKAVTENSYRQFKSIEMRLPSGETRPATVEGLFN
ncbi:type II secretion system secretin GspD [Marinomonas sp. C2222]|uniref:Type II secretion system secretin GspD n=1 Tax=Marinomonas sargassi TaxID=2984494 RepID=A0ABT2YNJ3_9GAMM|nr:type II secretion system secretin GspD [Marinomonas sargassi]MCV2401452.1 type II secretion system secretin GspD [Marinomonas sargassi]